MLATVCAQRVEAWCLVGEALVTRICPSDQAQLRRSAMSTTAESDERGGLVRPF